MGEWCPYSTHGASRDYCANVIPFIDKWYVVDKSVELLNRYIHFPVSPDVCSNDFMLGNEYEYKHIDLKTMIL